MRVLCMLVDTQYYVFHCAADERALLLLQVASYAAFFAKRNFKVALEKMDSCTA